MRIWRAIALAGAALHPLALAAQPAPPAGMDAAARAVDAEAARHPNGSMTVGIVIRGRLAWVRSYGFTDLARRHPATADTVYRLGSITKQFTGYSLLALAAAGRVTLDAPVVRFVPEAAGALGPAGASVDLLALATHRAGLAREPEDAQPSYSRGPIADWQALTIAALAHTRAPFAAGDQGRYSNIGYAILGLAVERASGMPYIRFVERTLLRPLNMQSTGFSPTPSMLSRLSTGVRNSQGTDTAQVAAELAEGRGYRVPNGGLFSTVPDLARFMALEMGYAALGPLTPRKLDENFASSFPATGGGRFGVGFTVEAFGARRLVGHNGLTTGYASSAFFDPDAKIGVICLGSAENMCQTRFVEVYAALAAAWRPVRAEREAVERALAERVRAQQPYPDGEAVLRRFVAELEAGAPDYARLGSVLGGAVRDHLPALEAQFQGLGAVQSVRFLRVDDGGADVYETRFANGGLQWTLTIRQGVLETAVMRPLP